jgi:hypothetical protein
VQATSLSRERGLGTEMPLRQLFTASRLRPISVATPEALARMRRM